MESYLSKYLVSEQDLSKISTELKHQMADLMSSENRLHCFIQLYEIAKSAVEQLESTDKEGFIRKISEDLDILRSNLDIQLEEQSRLVKKDFENLLVTAQNADKELQARGACIESVLTGMGKIEDFQQQLQQIRTLMDIIEQKMVDLKNIRQSEPFIEMCKLITNES